MGPRDMRSAPQYSVQPPNTILNTFTGDRYYRRPATVREYGRDSASRARSNSCTSPPFPRIQQMHTANVYKSYKWAPPLGMRGGEGQYPAFAAQTRYPAAGSEHCTRLGGTEPACDKPPADMPVTPLL